MVVATLCIGFLYFVLIISIIVGYHKIPFFSSENKNPKTHFSIVIPFRNEAANLPKLLKSIAKLEYPTALYELIFIDDASSDNSSLLIADFFKTIQKQTQITILQNIVTSNAPKKDAITLAIEHAKHHWIITTDADGILPKNWLLTLDAFIQKNNPIAVAAPVKTERANSFIEAYQQIDITSLQVTTAGLFGLHKPILCNGANFAYTKKAFKSVGGFSGNNHIASGDDVFLLEKLLKQFPKQVHYLKSYYATITTSLEKNWNNLLSQRIRWASKTTKQQSYLAKLIGGLVLITNMWFIALFVSAFIISEGLFLFIAFFMVKLCLDFWVIQKSKMLLNAQFSFGAILATSMIYPFVTLLIVFKSWFGNYTWKDRSFKNR